MPTEGVDHSFRYVGYPLIRTGEWVFLRTINILLYISILFGVSNVHLQGNAISFWHRFWLTEIHVIYRCHLSNKTFYLYTYVGSISLTMDWEEPMGWKSHDLFANQSCLFLLTRKVLHASQILPDYSTDNYLLEIYLGRILARSWPANINIFLTK